MATELTDVLNALATQLGTASEITAYPLFPPMNSLVFPAVCCGEFSIGPVEDFAGTRTYTVDVTVMVRPNTPDRGQADLWRYLTPTPTSSIYSLEAAIDTDPSLGGVVQYAWVSAPVDHSLGATIIDQDAEVLGAKFTVSIWA